MIDPWGRGEGAQIRHLVPDDGPAELAASVFEAVAVSALRSVEIVETAARRAERIVLGGGGASSALIRAAFERRRPGAVTAIPGRELAAEGAALVAAGAVPAGPAALVSGVH
jgi:sugar (pentulose or hexulose) kinase